MLFTWCCRCSHTGVVDKCDARMQRGKFKLSEPCRDGFIISQVSENVLDEFSAYRLQRAARGRHGAEP